MALRHAAILWTNLLSGHIGVVAQAAAESDRRPAMVRRHQNSDDEASVVQLGASGDMVNLERSEQQRSRGAPQEFFASKQKSTESDFCSEAYVLGNVDTNNCSDPSLHSLILRQMLCEEAAAEAAGQTGTADARFQLDYEHIDKYPIGCFKKADSNVFFFNPNGDWPLHQASGGGVPVCSRRRFENGTTDQDNGCPANYAKILDIDTCRAAAECEGYCTHSSLFHVGIRGPTDDPQIATDPRPSWVSRYDLRPSGCFINHEDGCVYFNEPQATAPSAPVGIPMCNISLWTS